MRRNTVSEELPSARVLAQCPRAERCRSVKLAWLTSTVTARKLRMSGEEAVWDVLQGHVTAARRPSPRLLKVFIASTRTDFAEERRQLLEVVGPELQSQYDNLGLEVELVDMHYGTASDPALDAPLFEDHLHEIRHCHAVSRGCFFLCLVGNKYLPYALPRRLDGETYEALYAAAADLSLRADLLHTCFCRDDAAPAATYVLQQPSDVTTAEWASTAASLAQVVQAAARHLLSAEGAGQPAAARYRQLALSAVERQFSHALGLAPGTAHRILAVVRDWEKLPPPEEWEAEGAGAGPLDFQDPPGPQREQLKNFRDRLAASLPNENRVYLAVPWSSSSAGLDPDSEEHEAYLTKFRELATAKLKALIARSLEEEPEVKARNKAVQEVFQEAQSHLELISSPDMEPSLQDPGGGWSECLDKVKAMMVAAAQGTGRHPPVVVRGGPGSGKTLLLAAVHRQCADWLGDGVVRVFRACGATPRSAYNLELLRILCQHLRLLLDPADADAGAAPPIPKDASFDPLYVNNWFQTLLRRFEEGAAAPPAAAASPPPVLVVLLDDLQRLNPLDSDIVAALSWLPVSLPRRVHVVATSALPPDQLKITPLQRERFRASDCCVELAGAVEPAELERRVESSLEQLEEQVGRLAVSRLAAFLTATEFGLCETELLELLMPTTGGALSLAAGHFSFSSMCAVRRRMGDLLQEKLMSGRLLVCWRHELAREVARRRYLHSQDVLRATHAEVGNLFFSEFSGQQASEGDGDAEESAPSPTENKETPFQTSFLPDDVTYSLRHVEESWIHLLKAGDSCRLKQLTVCNFDFLLAAVQTVSVSYLRCVLEHVRCYLLDRDLELVYYTIRKSSDVLTRDPLQLGAQVVCWLRPVADDSGDLVSHMITAAMAWCDGYTAPLLVPLNGWLQPPLPLQIKSLHCPAGVKLLEPTPSGQHLVVVPHNGDPQLWHVMSNTLTHTFKGHSGPVLCLAITKQSQYLLTGSDDISIIVWDLKSLQLKLRIYEHIAPVLCLTPALSNAVIVSGGEDSRIIITSLLTGDVVMKIDHHRGPVTAVKVTAAGDVLVSGSSDSTVCLWSLENFNLLNSISLASPVTFLDVSLDSVFLVAACEDNQLYLRSLATGTEIHCLRGHKAEIRSVCLAQDNCRAVVGGSDGKIYIFDMHSGRLSRTLTSHTTEVSGVKVTEKDDFLISSGGNRITFWSFRRDDATGHTTSIRKTSQHSQQMHSAAITCLDISRDGTMAVTGGVDSLVNIWQLNTHELHSTLEGHFASVTCVAFSPNGLFAVSGSEDKTARVWGLTLGLVVSVFKGHQATITAVTAMMDSRRVVTADRQGILAVWLADNATLLHSCGGPSQCLAITNSMKYVVCGNGDTSLRIWAVNREDERYTVSHSEEITCFVLTMDSQYVITGSRDMSLKVWQVAGGKLAQVLVGHSDHVTCVAVSILNKSLVVSGSRDSNLIVWDINTGNDIHILSGHLGCVTTVKVSGDGSLAVSGSEDKSIIVWDTRRGRPLSCLQLQVPILSLEMSTDCSRIAVHLLESRQLPIICLHNTPATYVKMPSYVAPAKEVEDLRPTGPKRPMRRLLKKEVSLDTYTWQKKYGHLTSSIMMAAVDERLKRRFSVSASMEEISKIPTKGSTMGSQQCVGPEQAALAQSQHFDQLEALWNKRSPPRRRHNQSLSKQNSRSSRRDSSDNDERTPGEEIVDFPGDRVCV
ncbi:protein qui-1 [Schistocerca gregaria]|uniref:protein qui-1 n=1 Tax=Schistocerca gregaria TaxID=7010 RepID=UPI00211E3B57|nr:protein qui-1 [Schistocerca gregaria]